MKFTTTYVATAVTALASLALSAPSPVSSPAEGVVFERAAQINDCGPSTIENQTSGGSPTVSDCMRLHDNIAGDGTWTIGPFTQRTLATYGTCAFGVNTDIDIVKVGNEDIRDLIRDSIRLYQWNGLIGSKGAMRCQGLGGSITWGLYHT